MLSSVLNSDRAIMVNIQIIRIFTRMRQLMLSHKDILLKLEKLELEVASHDEKIKLIFDYYFYQNLKLYSEDWEIFKTSIQSIAF